MPAGGERQADGDALERFRAHAVRNGGRRAGLERALGADRHFQIARLVGAVHDRETRLEGIAFHHLVGQARADLGGLRDLEGALAQTHQVVAIDAHGQHAPTGEIVRHLESETGATLRVRFERRVPVADELEHRAHGGVRAAVAAGVGALLLVLAPSQQLREQVVVAHVERAKLIERIVGIVVTAPALDEVEHGLVEHDDRDFAVDRLSLLRERAQVDGDRVARLVHLLLRLYLVLEFLERVLDLDARVTDAEGGLAEIDRAVLDRLGDARRSDRDRDVEARQQVRRDRDFNEFGAVVELAHPGLHHAEAFDGDQRLRTRERVLHQETRLVTDLEFGFLRQDVETVTGLALPHHLAAADRPALRLRGVCAPACVLDAGDDAIAAGARRGEGAGRALGRGLVTTLAHLDPLVGVLRQVGVARTLDARRLGLAVFDQHVDARAGHHLAVFVHHQRL